MGERTCPDCETAMRRVGHTTTYSGDGIRVDTDGGVLGALDLKGDHVQTYVCPDCGLVRFYAE
ncbi:hypothetical protein [Halogeometricum limi]|uniref:Nucleic-acid-binding protein containing Zn-ribbon domain n=1 Tax=Halogeometricum limi TaxID=555875 RepID=A0A1I6I443_9EURY|nr:hypothetical protein [Halogeometricum limi]SFR61515.1 hypothetical protein SAMN04488124_2796 [Halogeometricum limi]